MTNSDLTTMVRDDGYTITKHIKEIPNFYRAITFQMRPVGMLERSEFFDKVTEFERKEKSELKTNHAAAKMMMLHIKEWDAVSQLGKPVPLDVEAILQSDTGLHPAQFSRLRNIVCYCTEGGDELPGKSGNSAEDDELERLQKNSLSA